MLMYLVQISDQISGFNVFRYLTFRTAGAIITALLFVFLFGPAIIRGLRVRQGKGQPIREDGPQSHLLTKKGTPTMGGLMILTGMIMATLLWANWANPYVWIVLFVTVGFALIGFYDDYLKVARSSHKGFSSRMRLAIEAVIAGVACFAVAQLGEDTFSTSVTFPVLQGYLAGSGLVFRALRPVCDRRGWQCGQPHGRS